MLKESCSIWDILSTSNHTIIPSSLIFMTFDFRPAIPSKIIAPTMYPTLFVLIGIPS